MIVSLTQATAGDGGIGAALSNLVGYLQVPVLLVSLGMLVVAALESGRLLTELWRRLVASDDLVSLVRRVIAAPDEAGALAALAPSVPAAAAVAAIGAEPAAAEVALTDYEHAVQRRLDRTRLLVRAGPAFGLMGTLIPLAPGLTALGDGNIPGLTAELRTAFAATVIGILVGTVAFGLTLTRARLYSEDLTALERAVAAPQEPASHAAVRQGAAEVAT